jgi:hypothetical protein
VAATSLSDIIPIPSKSRGLATMTTSGPGAVADVAPRD